MGEILKNLKEYGINFLITLIIFALIFSVFNFEKIVQVILNSNYYLLFAAVIVYLAVTTLMALRIKAILNKINYKIPFLSIIQSNLAGMILSDFTPARTGYFFTAFSLSSKHKIPIHDSILTILGPQLFDFMVKAVSIVILLIVLSNTIKELQENVLSTIISILGIFIIIGFFGALVFVKGFIRKFLFIKKLPFGNKVYSLFDLMQKKSHELMSMKWDIVTITFSCWFTKALEWYLLSKALGIVIFDGLFLDYFFIMVFQASITLIQFIPLPTIAGGGASEVGFSGILYLLGIPLETGIAFALLTRLVMIVGDSFGISEVVRYIREGGIGKIFEEIDSIEHASE